MCSETGQCLNSVPQWYDLVSVFGRQEGSLSLIFIATLVKIMLHWGHLLDFNPSRFQNRLQEWAAAIAAHSAGIDPLLRIVLFIDGTLRGTTRPHPAYLPAYGQSKHYFYCEMLSILEY